MSKTGVRNFNFGRLIKNSLQEADDITLISKQTGEAFKFTHATAYAGKDLYHYKSDSGAECVIANDVTLLRDENKGLFLINNFYNIMLINQKATATA